jgi:hypothetical protein
MNICVTYTQTHKRREHKQEILIEICNKKGEIFDLAPCNTLNVVLLSFISLFRYSGLP